MSGRTEAAALALEPAREEDRDAVVALANRAYRGEGGWNAETGLIEGARITRAQLDADLETHPDVRLLVHRQDGAPVACVRLEPKGDGVWHLGLLAVDPRLQAGGLGRHLLTAAEAFVAAEGGSLIRMGVIDVRETLIAWYHRRGYALTGESEPYPYGDDRFGRPLREGMRFVVLEKGL
jgi:ribosomal protein S18 acetylase RimI-like enzyme